MLNADIISITWTLMAGFLIPGAVLAASPYLMVAFAHWVEKRATAVGYTTEWSLIRSSVIQQQAELPDPRAEFLLRHPQKDTPDHD